MPLARSQSDSPSHQPSPDHPPNVNSSQSFVIQDRIQDYVVGRQTALHP